MTARLVRLTRTTLAAICAMVVLVAGGTTAALATTSAVPTTGTITGTISDPSGYPLAGITIQLWDNGADEGSLVATATTDSAGRYRFAKVATDGDDAYRFEAEDLSGAHLHLSSGTFVVPAGRTTTHNGTMKLAGFIQGKVSTKDGAAAAQPAKNVVVEADGGDVALDAKVSAKGFFRLGGLPTGTYRVRFQDSAGTFTTTCYNNVPTINGGRCPGMTTVAVTAGKTTTLKPQVLHHKLGQLSGSVADTNGAPLQGMTVEVRRASDQAILAELTTKADGSWTSGIGFVGTVKVEVWDTEDAYRTTWFKNAVDFAHATALQLKDEGKITGINVVMPKK